MLCPLCHLGPLRPLCRLSFRLCPFRYRFLTLDKVEKVI